MLEQLELTRFNWGQVVYIDAEHSWQECMLMECALEGFRYDLRTGHLDFATEWSYRDDMAYSTSRTVAGDRIYFFGYTGDGAGSSDTLLWTDQTHFSVSPPPVPEPGMPTMLLAGIGMLGLVARRKRG
ncbi:PEP-CTERM sorting domain-containing protein [Pseudoduganella sp. OTU4001]|uniref:PEP-CTERM sorting domain-containing protein n=1 Tax=Pseudoduganella sp. OTU4001 TaxID=3043854 RepID=UPI00313E8170